MFMTEGSSGEEIGKEGTPSSDFTNTIAVADAWQLLMSKFQLKNQKFKATENHEDTRQTSSLQQKTGEREPAGLGPFTQKLMGNCWSKV